MRFGTIYVKRASLRDGPNFPSLRLIQSIKSNANGSRSLKKSIDGALSEADSRFYVEQEGVAPKKAILVRLDETDIYLCPGLRTKGLQLKGQQVKIEGFGLDEVCYLFGSTSPFTGEGLYEIYNQKASCQFCFHLEHLMEAFPDYFIFVVSDNYLNCYCINYSLKSPSGTYHSTNALRFVFLSRNLRVVLLYHSFINN